MPWIRRKWRMDTPHRCRRPWMWWWEQGSRWRCPKCDRVWEIYWQAIHWEHFREWRLVEPKE